MRRERSAAIAARDQAEDLAGFMLEDLAGDLRPVGRLQVLEKVARKALEYYERSEPGIGGAAAPRRGKAFGIVAEVLADQGDRDAAVEAATTGLAIHRRLAEASPGDHDLENHLALAHLRLGGILRLARDGGQEPARKSLEAAFAIASRLVELDPGHVEWRQTLAESLYLFGMFNLFDAGDPETARREFERAIAVYRRLAAEHPSQLRFKFRLAVLHGQGLGQTYRDLGQEAESLAAIEQAYELYRQLTRADPSNSKWQHGFAWENRRLGEHLAFRGRLDEALERYGEALDISRRLLSLEPSNVDWRHGLASDHSAIGALHEQGGDLTAALASFETSIGLFSSLLETGPDDDLRHWLATDLAAAGSVLRRLGRGPEAADAWRRSAELLAPDAAQPEEADSQVLEIYALALLRLGRADEARPTVERLRRRGWFEGAADGELVELCRERGWIV